MVVIIVVVMEEKIISYRDLKIYQMVFALTLKVREMSLKFLEHCNINPYTPFNP